jgi:hypothetical protein
MDSFERLLQEIDSMDKDRKRSMIDSLKAECICPDCPTYNECAGEGGELLYCFLEKSPVCIKEEMGCICPDCPVAAQADLVNLYFCTIGSELEMRRK